jgi:TonB-linked SusC/RagA family outer membrane protein
MKKFLLLCFSFVFASFTVLAQDRVISGKVTSTDDGISLPGVNVVLKGTTNGAVTDSDGNYKISVPSSGGTLTFSFIGYKTMDIVIGDRATVDVQLESDVQQLSEVVVTAGGLTVQKRELGSYATTVKATDITQGKSSNIAAGLSGKVPGLLVTAVSSGVNPSYRLVLRGNRSLTGNNQALIILDNIITPNNVLGNLNPEDIEDIQVLNGAGAAALYGSDASNGALIITTKKGKAGRTEVKISNTTTFEQVSYLPKLQKEFGSGTTPDDVPIYTPYENQQYGPRFDGSTVIIGKPIEDGSIQSVKYSPTNARTDFWETGVTNQTDFSISSGSDKSTFYLAGQYFKQSSTVPYDEYKRYSFRVNGETKVLPTLKVSYTANFISNVYDQSSDVGTAYNDVLMSPAQVDITKYKNWRTDPFANPNGYYNEYYDNPYFTLANNRSETKNDYLQGNIELKWNPISPLTFTSRIGISTRSVRNKTYTGKFIYSDYTKGISGGSKTDTPGFVSDYAGSSSQIVSDFLAEYKTNLSDNFNLTAVLGTSVRSNPANDLNASTNGLVIDGLYNLGNSLNQPAASQSSVLSRQIGVYGDVRLGFKDYLFLHMTARNDWRSVLAKENRSFFYPSADISFIASDAFPGLKNEWIDQLKIRGGYSQVGQVNLGAYQLNSTYSQAFGYPYSSGPGFTLNNTLVSPKINPEITTGIEAGFDLDLRKYSGSIGLTVYKTNTVDQTIYVNTSTASGFSVLLTNVGEVQNKGLETYVRATPIETSFGLNVTVGATYTLNRNEVISLSNQSDNLVLSTFGGSRVLAKVGSPFPLLQSTDYNRDSQGRVIVDAFTGLPATDGTFYDVGITTPPHILGLNTELTYKGFRLAAVAEYRNGHYIYNGVSTSFDFSGAGIRTTWFDRERFVMPNSSYEDPENPGSFIENTNITTRTGGADFWTSGAYNTGIGMNYTNSAGFWKIREISLRYDFPAAMLSGLKLIKAASISVQGRNLFIWTPKTNLYTDPEYSVNGTDSNAVGFTSIGLTPPARYMGATISLTF